jgi:hypothetical protein
MDKVGRVLCCLGSPPVLFVSMQLHGISLDYLVYLVYVYCSRLVLLATL